jgi:6-phosphogluconolactonase
MELIVTPDPSVAAAERVAARLRDAVRRRGTASMALSGGGTAPPMIDALGEVDVPWEAVGVWQVDERVAPDGHDARNAGQLQPLEQLPCRVRPMPVTAGDLRAAARRYAATLPDRFDVVHLGIGDDGHTASWPPDDPAVRTSRREVELVDMFNGWPRMTLTRRVVNAARSRVVLTTGASKRPMVTRWLEGDRSLPITAVRRTATWVFVDEAAAPSSGSG